MRRCHRPYLYLSDMREPCSPRATAWGHRSVCTYSRQWSRVNDATILHVPKKEVRYTYLDKIDHLEIEIVHILVIITAVTQNRGNCRKSRHKAKITVIVAIVNSWFTYIPIDNSRTGQLADSEFLKIMELLYFICTLNLTITITVALSNIDSI